MQTLPLKHIRQFCKCDRQTHIHTLYNHPPNGTRPDYPINTLIDHWLTSKLFLHQYNASATDVGMTVFLRYADYSQHWIFSKLQPIPNTINRGSADTSVSVEEVTISGVDWFAAILTSSLKHVTCRSYVTQYWLKHV